MSQSAYVKHHVLVTGFGPFGTFKENPSWLAVSMLHDTLITSAPERGASSKNTKRPMIHLTCVNVSTVYSTVLDTVPGFHAQPPILPDDRIPTGRALPENGFDLIIHVGVGDPGGLCAERLARKSGYRLADHEQRRPPLADGKGPSRGFGAPRYGKAFPEELYPLVDVDGLAEEMSAGPDPVMLQPSDDAGLFLCEFIYYCSLAESQRAGRSTRVLFVHCPPVKDKLSSEEVAHGLRRIIQHICSRS